MKRLRLPVLVAILVFGLSACGDTTEGAYSIGGTVSGLPAGGTVTVTDNASEQLHLGVNGAFTFQTVLAAGSPYAVTVTSQFPTTLSCTVADGSGTASADVSTVHVSCQAAPATFTIGGTIIGLPPGASIALKNTLTASTGAASTSESLIVNSNGRFTFVDAIAAGATYAVAITAATGIAPICAMSGASGTVVVGTATAPTTNVTSIAILCKSAQFVYVSNQDSNDISAYYLTPGASAAAGTINPIMTGTNGKDPTTGQATPTYANAAGARGPTSLAATPSGRFLYTANGSSANVTGFSINPATGALSIIPGSPFPAGGVPLSVTVDPSGSFVYVANSTGNTVSAYRIDTLTGALTKIADYVVGAGPNSITLDLAGSALYVNDSGDSTIYAFSLNAVTGALTKNGGSPFHIGGFDNANIAVNPAGTLVYVTGDIQNVIYVLQVNATTGALTPTASSPLAGSPNQYPTYIVLNAEGTYAYTANDSGNGLSGYSVDPTTGNLTAVPGSPYQFVGTWPVSTAVAATVNPAGTALYTVRDQDWITAYGITAATGSLTQLGGLVSTGTNPTAVVITQAP